MAVRLKSHIMMGTFQFSGVHEVRIKRSLHSYVDTCTIELPSIAQVVRKGKTDSEYVITGKQFTDGDPVRVSLGYDDDMRVEFEGFIKRRNLNMPLQVECEGYSYQLRRNEVSGFWKKISVKSLLAVAVTGTDVTIDCQVDIDLTNIKISQGTGADIIDYILRSTDGCLTAFFITPSKLWVGLIYTPYSAGSAALSSSEVKYRLGWNVVKDNSLKERVPENDPVIVKFLKKTSKGKKLEGDSKGVTVRVKELARRHRKILNHIASQLQLENLAKEKELRLNYTGYDGKINSFLQPYCLPGYKAYIKDARYGEKDGVYLAEGIEVSFGQRGARRTIDIGPKIGFQS